MARKSFPLRIEKDIYDALEAWAASEFRSVNGHIEFLLREALRKNGRLGNKQKSEKGKKEE